MLIPRAEFPRKRPISRRWRNGTRVAFAPGGEGTIDDTGATKKQRVVYAIIEKPHLKKAVWMKLGFVHEASRSRWVRAWISCPPRRPAPVLACRYIPGCSSVCHFER
jgi:hypothetical protein